MPDVIVASFVLEVGTFDGVDDVDVISGWTLELS